MKEMPEAAAQLLQKPSLANLDLLLELATPPLTFYATILTTLLLMSFAFSMQIGSVVCGAWVCMIGLAAVILHLVSAVPLTGMPMRNLYDLAGVPFFLIWKLLLLPRIWRERKSKVWIRTERTPSPTTKK